MAFVRLAPIDEARVEALIAAGIAPTVSEAVRYALRLASRRHGFETERESNARAAYVARTTPRGTSSS